MKKLKNKLASRRGATLLFALLVFLLCVLAGTAALTAAATNSGRYTHMASDQQKYLAVSSAVELVKNELTKYEFKVTFDRVETTTYRDWPTESTTTDTVTTAGAYDFSLRNPDPAAPPVSTEFLFEDLFKEYFMNACKYELQGEKFEGVLSGKITLSLEGMSDVTVDVSAHGYDITMNFYIDDGGDEVYYSTMTLSGKSVIKSEEPKVERTDDLGGNYTIITTRSDAFTVSWDEQSVTVSAMKPEEGG